MCVSLLAVLFDVLASELVQVWGVLQSDLLRFLFRRLDCEAVAQHSPDHPECAHSYGGGAVNERGPVLGIIGELDLFLPESGPSPLERAKLKGRQRQRASACRMGHGTESGKQ